MANGGTIINQQNATLNLVKVDKDQQSIPLEGAVFELFRYEESSWTKVGQDARTGSEGTLSFSGLYPGYYQIKEKTAPAGYMYTGDGSFYVKVDETGIHLLVKGNGTDPAQWSAAQSGTTGDVLNFTAEQDGNSWTAIVGNPAGVVLPSTGGTGTGAYTIVGLTILLCAATLLLLRRRSERK